MKPQQVSLNELSILVKERLHTEKRLVIGLSGFGGAGKTALAASLAADLEDCESVHLDDFILDRLSARSKAWEGFDWERLVAEVLQPASEGAQSIEYGVYDWSENKIMKKRKVPLKKCLLLEGVGLIRKDLMRYFDLTIWIDVPLEIASERGRERDSEQYNSPEHAALWDELWIPNDRDYFENQQPQLQVDYLLRN